MKLIIRDQAQEAGEYVANYIVETIQKYNPSPARQFVLGLPTGSSPIGVYKALVASYKAGKVSFKHVITFNMDEYVGIPRDHPESYHTFMFKHFFSHVDIRPSNVNILNGNATDLEAECAEYEAKIRRAGGIDLFLAGIGEDGHIAFNEPGSSLASRTRVMPLAYDTILVNSRFFGNDIDKVPKEAMTVGVQTVLDAREVVVVALGPRKAMALQKCIEGSINHMWTLSSIQLHPNAMIVCDEDATLELQVKTVKYFKSIERSADDKMPSSASASLPMPTGSGHQIPRTVVQLAEGPTERTPLSPQYTIARTRGLSPGWTSHARDDSPDWIPDRMIDRVVDAPKHLLLRLTPTPEQQAARQRPRVSAQ